MTDPGALTDVPGLAVGHAASAAHTTGCTVVLPAEPCVLVADVRGGAAGTRETTAVHRLGPANRVDAIALCGGSTFGLAAVDGILQHLAEAGRGVQTGGGRVPRVPAAVLHDLALAPGGPRPDATLGRQACRSAGSPAPERGNVGAGVGATVGKIHGPEGWMKGGLGQASVRLPDGALVGALAVVNAFGDVVDPGTGQILAGARRPGTLELADSTRTFLTAGSLPERLEGISTTLVVLATDVALQVPELGLFGQAGHDGIAAVIRPSHTQLDGDVAFVLTTEARRGASLLRLLTAARRATELALQDAARAATSLVGVPAVRDLPAAVEGDRGSRV
jgi:L-aminopeptidase/D-esterase-like protein